MDGHGPLTKMFFGRKNPSRKNQLTCHHSCAKEVVVSVKHPHRCRNPGPEELLKIHHEICPGVRSLGGKRANADRRAAQAMRFRRIRDDTKSISMA